MATTIFYNGRVTAKPGSFSEIDASGLEAVGLGASGIVAVLGTAEGGRPISAITSPRDLLRVRSPSRARRAFRGGDLREACALLFEPSNDPQIAGGAQEIVVLKVNPAVQSTLPLSSTLGTAVQVTSVDYGAFTEQINVSVAAGTTQGRLLTVSFEDTIEAVDDVGGSNMFTLQYTPPAGSGGWETMRMQVLSSGVRAFGTRTDTGLSSHISAAITSGATVTVAGTAADAGRTLTVYGLAVGGAPVREAIILDASGDAIGVQTWSAVYGMRLNVAAGATITLSDTSNTTALCALTVGQQERGLVSVSAMYVAGVQINAVVDAAATDIIQIWGLGATNAVQSAALTMTGTTEVTSAASWNRIDVIVLGDLADARTLTIQAVAAATVHTTQNTLQKVSDYFSARAVSGVGFIFTMVTGTTTLNPANLDYTSSTGVDVYNVAGAATADTYAVVNALTTSTSLVTATRIAFAPQIRTMTITVTNSATYTLTANGTAVSYTASGAATLVEIQNGLIAAWRRRIAGSLNMLATISASTLGVALTATTPSGFTLSTTGNMVIVATQETAGVAQSLTTTTAPLFLVGGTEGTTLFSHWQAALDMLRRVRVNTIVPLTGDPAVHAAVDAHCAYMCGAGKNERDAFIGLSALDGSDVPLNTLPSMTSALAQARALNTRHVRALPQGMTRFNTAGESTEFLPWFHAALAAGMQAGAPVGTSLTFKSPQVLDITQSSTWNPVEDVETMIQGGLLIAEEVDGVGFRYVRNVTTWLRSNNLAFIEGSVNAAVNFSAYSLRTRMEYAVGRRGFAGTINAAKGIATNELGLQLDAGILVQWRALTLELVMDVLELSVEIAPTLPINFVTNSIHLVTVRQLAA